MNPQDATPGTPEQQVIDRLKTAINVLVTVSNNPSVDQLAAAIAFTLLLNKLGKHATAVFSGDVPSTIEFLKPEATIEKNTDSLRDFIVSLDKSKADKLRYKVEQNVVKIFITPYRTSLTEKDLEFSQGDFNVDAIIALGISEREQLDQAIIAHGRILHDATVITITAGQKTSSLGAINWQNSGASSLCEMLSEVGDALQPGLMDNQIATAFLTGIVAQTDRFSNDKTSPKIMSLAAKLMAAGANQQLIANQLEQVAEVDLQVPVGVKPAVPFAPLAPEVKVANNDGALTINHEDKAKSDALEAEKPDTAEIEIDEHGNISTAEEAERAAEEAKTDKERKDASEKDEIKPRHKVLEPLPEPESVPDQPSFSAQGITEDGLNEPSTNPLVTPAPLPPPVVVMDTQTTSTGTIEPEAILPPSENDEQSPLELPDSPMPTIISSTPVENALTLPPALDDSTIHDLEKNVGSPHVTNDPSSTLDDLEEAVNSPHLASTEGVDSARSAVQDARDSAPYNPSLPEPRHALNADAIDLGLEQKTSDPVLAGLGLSDAVQPQSPDTSILPPPPAEQEQDSTNEDSSDSAAPPVPPPIVAL